MCVTCETASGNYFAIAHADGDPYNSWSSYSTGPTGYNPSLVTYYLGSHALYADSSSSFWVAMTATASSSHPGINVVRCTLSGTTVSWGTPASLWGDTGIGAVSWTQVGPLLYLFFNIPDLSPNVDIFLSTYNTVSSAWSGTAHNVSAAPPLQNSMPTVPFIIPTSLPQPTIPVLYDNVNNAIVCQLYGVPKRDVGARFRLFTGHTTSHDLSSAPEPADPAYCRPRTSYRLCVLPGQVSETLQVE